MALLASVADGQAAEAGVQGVELAEAFLAAPAVRLALGVREGGPLAIARAVGLAERVLQALAAEAPADRARAKARA